MNDQKMRADVNAFNDPTDAEKTLLTAVYEAQKVILKKYQAKAAAGQDPADSKFLLGYLNELKAANLELLREDPDTGLGLLAHMLTEKFNGYIEQEQAAQQHEMVAGLSQKLASMAGGIIIMTRIPKEEE